MEQLKELIISENLTSFFDHLVTDAKNGSVNFKKHYCSDTLIESATWFDNLLFAVYEANNLTKKEKIHYVVVEQLKENEEWIQFLINQGMNFEIKPDSMNLSGGQTHKVAIARSLLQEAQITVLDEPTSSYDALNTKKLIDCIKKLSKDRLFIVITHDKAMLEASEHSMMFDQGCLVAEGNSDELLKSNHHYQKIFI